jgi:hypothetical protein
MAQLQDVFSANLTDYKVMAHALEVLWQRGAITRNQMHAVATTLVDYLPAHVMVSQRLPKSVTYFHLLGKACVKVSNRARVTVDYTYLRSDVDSNGRS